jgi:tRNA pseudouridine38-40 synthase
MDASTTDGGQQALLIIEYHGGAFHGWQAQADGNVRTVQAEVQRALHALTGLELPVQGASRTDQGVHAAGQAATCWLPPACRIPVENLAAALNTKLPWDARIVAARAVAPDFKVMENLGKRYRYLLQIGGERSALLHAYAWHLKTELDLDAMRAGARLLTGRHDYSAFVNQLERLQALRASAGKPPLKTVRHLWRIAVDDVPAEGLPLSQAGPRLRRMLRIEVEGDGFLYNMVRNLAGSLVDVGRGLHPPTWLAEVLTSRDRCRAGQTAPPHGLYLCEVFF